ncbi:hypothetical protein [Nocardioides lijunqiniae]|nr:hypothetical protein [Nocardioides lijunqiniae]
MSAFDPLMLTLARHQIDERVAKASQPRRPARRHERTARRLRAIADRLDS